ncbi:hypothetical protein ACHAAC_06305 [Aeromicrobium sp. CF4.19]|uniref:hypothetical protein n=1 Tax=Aeromicrobium sp. CF4.19 TaxID=3373082 RepID=UPI003EE53484
MRAARQESISISSSPGGVFDAALGVVQNNKNARILAVHTEGRKLVVREKAKMSNPKLQHIWVEGEGEQAQLNVAVGSDPRSTKALMDGKANEKSLARLVEAVQAALDGSAPAPSTPLANHYLQKKAEIPWVDASQDPEIELDGNFLAMYNF